MKKNHLIILTILIFSLGTVSLGWSQTSDRIFSDVRRLELYMLKVWEVVKQFDDAKAVEYMTFAHSELAKAKDLIYTANPRYVLARIHLGKAKQYTDLASRLVLQKPFINLKSQLNDLINQAEQAVSNSNRDEVHYLLNQAKKFRRRAYQAFQENKIGRGEEYYRASFFFARKCLEFFEAGEPDRTEQFENLKISVEQLLVQAEDLVASEGEGRGSNLLREAQSHYEDAIKKDAEGRKGEALKKMLLVKRLVYRLIDQLDRAESENSDYLQNNIYALRTLLESFENDMPNPRASKLLEKSWQLYREAEQNYENGNYRESRSKLMLSQRAANRLYKLNRSKDMLDIQQLREQLDETRHLLRLQESRVMQVGDKNITLLFNDAKEMLQRAEDVLNSGKNLHAFQLIQAATRMSSKIQRQLKKTAAVYDAASLDGKYRQIINTITNLKQNDFIQDQYDTVLGQIEQFAEKGKKFLDQNNLILAEEYLNTAWEQLKQFTDRWRSQ